MMHWNWGQNWGMTGFGGLMMILFWILVIGGIVLLIRMISGSSRPASGEEKPIDILKRRYAKGEITKKEYDEMSRDLR